MNFQKYIQRDTIFISHASPEDNFFASWLASKLKLLGYEVWLDTNKLRGGDSFWPIVEQKIKTGTIRFVALVSSNYIKKAYTPQTGVRKEISCACSVKHIDNFIIPLRIDDSSFDNFPIDIIELNSIDFNQKWGIGLTNLVDDLIEASIPRHEQNSSILDYWYECRRVTKHPIKKDEKYFLNWFRLQISGKVYLHQPYDINRFHSSDISIRDKNKLISFEKNFSSEFHQSIVSSKSILTSKFMSNKAIELDDGYVLPFPNKKLIELLNLTFRNFLTSKNLCRYLLSGNKELYYYDYSDENKKQINLAKFGKNRKQIVGNYKDSKWHYGITYSSGLFPEPHFKISSHLVFTDNMGTPLNKANQHKYRRSLAKSWFNKDWLELMLAFFTRLADNHDCINIDNNSEAEILLEIAPISLDSKYGYIEPTKHE